MASNVPETSSTYVSDTVITTERVQRHRDFLKESLEPDSGILDKLLPRTLTKQEVAAIKSSNDPFEKAGKLIDKILENNATSAFVTALRDTNQTHLVNYLKANGEYNELFGDEWPLTEHHLDALDTNYGALTECLDPCDLLCRLLAEKVINNKQYKIISEKSGNIEKNEVLLDAIRRRSIRDYKMTIICLNESNQEHLAKVLETGVLAAIRCTVDGDSASEVEDEIVLHFAAILRDRPRREIQRILDQTQLKVAAIKKGKSIYLYVFCEILQELLALYELLESGAIKEIVEELFNRLVSREEKISVSYTFSKEQFEKLKKFLEAKQRTASSEISRKLEEMEVSAEEEIPEVQEAEGSERGEPQVEQKKLDPTLTDEEVIAAIIRNNTDFLNEHMRSRGIIDELRSLGILTDDQTRYIKTLRQATEKNDEVLNIIRSRKAEDYAQFIDCLRRAGQTLAADVAEFGGVVVKVKITHKPMTRLSDNEKEIIARLNQLQQPAIPKGEGLLLFLSQLKHGGLEIMSARHDRGIVMWLWCRSKQAIVKLDKLNETESEDLAVLFNGLFSLLLSGETLPTISGVYLDDTDKDFVCGRLSEFSLVATQTITEKTICGVAKLSERIHVLCKLPTTIIVFDEKNLKKSLQELPVEEIGNPVDIVSCSKSSCLYISDSSQGNIWKVSLPEYRPEIWLTAAADPYTLSVTKDGNVVMVKRGSSSSLEIYDPEAKLLRRLVLPSPILSPNHAVQTSDGHLIVSYGEGGKTSGICEIKETGEFVARLDFEFDPIPGLATEVNRILSELPERKDLFGLLCYLTLDVNDQVYACDWKCGGVAFLDSRLNLKTMIKRSELAIPLRVQFLKEERHLLVVHGVHGNIVSVIDTK